MAGRPQSKLVLRAVVGVLLLVLVICLRFVVFTPRGGDPNGTILKDLRAKLAPTSALAPPGATGVSTDAQDSVRHGACVGLAAAQGGWTKVRVIVSFDSSAPSSSVRGHVADQLRRNGWTRSGNGWGAVLHTGNEASATLLGSGGHRWRLTASVEPRYYAPAYC